MSKFQRSWALLKCSFRVIFANKILLLFPLILSVLMIVMVVFFLAPVVLWPTGHGLAEGAHWQAVARQWTIRGARGGNLGLTPSGYALAGVFYLVATCLATFVNVRPEDRLDHRRHRRRLVPGPDRLPLPAPRGRPGVPRGALSLCGRGHRARPFRCGTDERGMEDEVRRQAGAVKEELVPRQAVSNLVRRGCRPCGLDQDPLEGLEIGIFALAAAALATDRLRTC